MDFELTSEHLMLKESAASFVKKEHSFERLRELRNDPLGYTDDVYKKMAELGWMSLIYPEEYGGLGLDFSFALGLLEEFGRGLLPEPWLSTVMLGGNLVLMGGSESQKEEILPEIASGDLKMTAAYLEDDGMYELNFCSVSATKNGEGFSISGKKIFVLDGCSADKFIVTTRTSGSVTDKEGITLFIVPRDAAGLEIKPVKTMDGRNACMLEFKDVSVPESAMLGELDHGLPVFSEVMDQATAAICAEMVGGMSAAIDITCEYISERVQFGKAIGTFQALQHKAADMFIQKELAASTMYYAFASIEEKTEDRAMAVSVAKAKCSAAYLDVTKTAFQLCGAIAFTREADIGFFVMRAEVAGIFFGDTGYHLDRYATLKGY